MILQARVSKKKNAEVLHKMGPVTTYEVELWGPYIWPKKQA